MPLQKRSSKNGSVAEIYFKGWPIRSTLSSKHIVSQSMMIYATRFAAARQFP